MAFKQAPGRRDKTHQQSNDLHLEIAAVEAITLPSQPREGQSPMERLNDVCLEICQKHPFSSTPDHKLVSQSNPNERLHMLRLAKEAGIGLEDLVKVIRNSYGVQKDVFQKLNELKTQKKP